MRRLLFCLALLGVALPSVAFAAPPDLFTNPIFMSGDDPRWMVKADLNKDGRENLIIIDTLAGDAIIKVFGAGAAYVEYNAMAGGDSQFDHIVVGDVNDDGWPDLVASGYDVGGGFSQVFQHNGSTTPPFFTISPQYLNAGPQAGIGDIDDDGDAEIVTGDDPPDFWDNDGAGLFSSFSVTYSPLIAPVFGLTALEVADLTGGGSYNIFSAGQPPNPFYSISQDFNTTYQVQTFAAFGEVEDIITGDFDGDGDDDVLAFNTVGRDRYYRKDGGLTDTGFVSTDASPSFAGDAADFNLDGYMDYVVGQSGKISVFMGTPLGPQPMDVYNQAGNWTSVLAIDLDQDGADDIVGTNGTDTFWLRNKALDGNAINCSGSGNVDCRRSQFCESDTCQDRVSYGSAPVITSDDPEDFELVDFDLDGDLDILVANNEGGTDPILYANINNGGVFTGKDTSMFDLSFTGATAYNLDVGDCDRDGDVDIVAMSQAGANRRIVVYKYNSMTGIFEGTQVFIGGGVRDVIWVDADNDGYLDILMTDAGAPRLSFNDGNCGGFDLVAEDWTGPAGSAESIAAADVNGNGSVEIVIGYTGAASRVFRWNPGTSDMDLIQTIPQLGSTITDIGLGDLDNDSRLDLAFASGADNKLTILRWGFSDFQYVKTVQFGIGAPYGLDFSSAIGNLGAEIAVSNGQNSVYWYKKYRRGANRTGSVIAGPSDQYHNVRWGDLDGNGSLDILAQDVANSNLHAFYANPRVFGPTGIQFVTAADPRFTRWANYRQLGPGWMDMAYTDGFLSYTYYNRHSDLTAATTFGAFNATDMDWGDIDADGDLDLLMVRTTGQDVVRTNVGGGSFGPALNVGPAGDQTTAAALGDFNDDGYMDAITATPTEIYYYQYDPVTSTFPGVPTSTVANQNANVTDIKVADFDSDGNLDIFAASDNATWGGSVYRGDGAGSFVPGWGAGTRQISSVGLADVDGINGVDLILGILNGPNELRFNTGVGNFTQNGLTDDTNIENTEDTISIAVGDITGDGKDDVVTASSNGAIRAYEVTVGDWRLIWSSQRQDFQAYDVQLVDLDRDGDLDMFVSLLGEDARIFYNATNRVSVYRQGVSTSNSRRVLPNHPAYIYMNRPGGGDHAREYSSGKKINSNEDLSISFHLFDRDGDFVPKVLFEYSLDYGPWTNMAVTGQTTNLSADFDGELHAVTWNPGGISTKFLRIRGRALQNTGFDVGGGVPMAALASVSPGITLDPLDCNGGADCGGMETCVEDNCVPQCPCPGDDVCLDSVFCAPGTNTACVDDASCPIAGQFCTGGVCYDPCTDITCPAGQACYGGSCYDPCANDGDCSPPFACYQNRCTDDACAGIFCPLGEFCFGGACYPVCTTSGDCGADTCFESGANDHCATNACDNVQCASSEVCYEGGCFTTCINDGDCTPPNVCFDGYCSDDPCNSVTCPVGQLCYGGSCFDPCATTAECTPPEECYDATLCAVDPCDGVLCPSGQSCYQGSCFDGCVDDGDCSPPNVCFDNRCTASSCDDILCPEGQFCYAGSCFDPCAASAECMPPEQCWGNRCAVDPCDDIGCPAGQVCYGGSCFDPCLDDSECMLPDLCFDNRCIDDPCAGVDCPVGEICVGGSCFVGCALNTDCPNYQGLGSSFIDVAPGANTYLDSAKDAGAVFGDFDVDGCLDLMVNSSSSLETTQLMSDCNFPNPVFTGMAQCDRPHLYYRTRERSAITGDLNNDGYPDFVRNSDWVVQLYLNDGTGKFLYNPNGSNPNCPGTLLTDWLPGGGHSIYWGTRAGNGINAEGVVLIDYDGDKDLDLFIEEEGEGILVFRNNLCTGAVCGAPSTFSMTEIPAASIGISTLPGNGDYCAVADMDVDGDVDFICRKPGTTVRDLYVNNGAGSFSGSVTFNQSAGGNKGGVAFCDFDNDGDFDLYWSDNGTNQIWEQTSPNVWAATGEPGASSGTALPNSIDGVSCGDIDNDGDVDLFLSGGGDDYLFLNDSSGGTWDFTENNLGIIGGDNGESAVMADYDRSGSLDIFINQRHTELWKNPRVDDRYLIVRALVDLGGGVTRDGIGATITIRDADGAILGLREVNGGKGHGSQDSAWVHYGLPYGPLVPYSLTVQFPHGPTIERCVVPASIAGYQLVEISDTDSDDLTACTGAAGWQALIEPPNQGEFCYTDHCATDVCEGIQCGSESVCYGGNCKTACTTSFDCPSGEICDAGRCVDSGDPECDGMSFMCPTNWECIAGECFPICSDDSDCSAGEICYNGICVDTSCGGVSCGPGESCHEGVCFRDCLVDSDCTGSDRCYEGRCAEDGCQALTVTYDADFLFKKLGRTVTAYQNSTAWFWPRPVEGASNVTTYVGLAGGTSTNADVPSPGKARVMLYLDPSESNAANPMGRYMLWLQHGASVGQGASQATYRVRLDDPAQDDPDVVLEDDAEGYRVIDAYEWIIEAQATSGANDTGGVVIGPIDAERNNNWVIRIDAAFAGDITAWEFYNADGQIVPLKTGETLWLQAGDFSIADPIISPDSYMPCLSDRPSDRGICKRGFGFCNDERRLECVTTVAQWRYEVCDGEDNDCDGSVDEFTVVPQPEFRQSTGDAWLTWLTVDETQKVGDFVNYAPYGGDNRSGGTNMTTVDGNIQAIDYNVTAFHRNFGSGELSMITANGRPTTGATADTYGDYDAEMRFEFPDSVNSMGTVTNLNSTDEGFIAWYDDRAPGAEIDGSGAVDEIPEWEAIDRIDLKWRVKKTGTGATAYRDSDTAVLRAAWLGNNTERALLEGRLRWLEDDDDVYDDADEFRWRLYAPLIGTTELRKADPLHFRVRPRALVSSACLAAAPTLAGCQLGRYQCRAGVLSCSAAADAICNQCNDFDGDGHAGYDPVFCASGRDCNDSDRDFNPDAEELCDGFDNDCDGIADIKDNDAYLAYWGEPRPGTAAMCPAGGKCGPAECGYNLTCICPNGPGFDCRCGESLEEGEAPVSSEAGSVAPASNDDAGSEDPQAACASAPIDSPKGSAIFALLCFVGIALRRRRR